MCLSIRLTGVCQFVYRTKILTTAIKIVFTLPHVKYFFGKNRSTDVVQRFQGNGGTKNYHRCSTPDNLTIDRSTKTKILIDIELNFTSISMFAFIER